MKIRILPSAVEDLSEGFQFYENQKPGLGGYFLETLFSDIDSLKLYAGIHLKVYGYNRMLSKRFPYAIYYSTDSQTIFIIAVLDCRKDPEATRERFET